jgi:DNA-binding transcriptional regulator YhcF (GntR family)
VLAEDEQVMSTNQYAAFYRINPATAAKAFQGLEGRARLPCFRRWRRFASRTKVRS